MGEPALSIELPGGPAHGSRAMTASSPRWEFSGGKGGWAIGGVDGAEVRRTDLGLEHGLEVREGGRVGQLMLEVRAPFSLLTAFAAALAVLSQQRAAGAPTPTGGGVGWGGVD